MSSGPLFLCLAALGAAQAALTTDRPIIGIVVQHLYSDVYDPSSNKTYIAASYVKFIEASGGRVVPVFVNQTDEYYERIFNSVNGILFPGGQADLRSSGYERATKVLFDLAVKANQKGTHFPIWGTCLGLEDLTRVAIDKLVLRPCNANDMALPLDFSPGRLFPFYAVQFHPEKTNFEWERNDRHKYVPHGPDALSVSQYLGNFFVNEARKNLHKFATEEEELSALIYNYPATFTQKHSAYTQMYIFDQPAQWPRRGRSRWGVRNSVLPVVPQRQRQVTIRRTGRLRPVHRAT